MSFKYPIAIAMAATLWTVSSCKVSKSTTSKTPVAVAEAAVSDTAAALKVYQASATKYWDLVHTGIDIRFHLTEKTADATAQLLLHPYYYSTDSVVLDAKSMLIKEVTDAGSNPLPLTYTYDSLQLHIHLPKQYDRNDTLHLKITYTALPYAGKVGGSAAIREDRGLYFINTNHEEPYLPVQVWSQGETESNSHWFPTFDNPIFKSTFTITLHVPDSFKTISNGTLVQSVNEPDHFRADTWNQNLPISTYLAMIAVGDYAISKESWRGKEVSYYVPQQYAAYGKDIFRYTPDMIEYLSNKLKVDYPWDKYSQVIGYQYVSGAMENVSASLFGAFNLKDTRQVADDNNDFIIVHELFHQWFGDYVTAESWSNLTLNESFADYSEHLWTAYKYGEDARGDYWMHGLGRYLGQSKYHDPPLLRFHYISREDMFDRISYSKGGLILHYLHVLAGDKAFFDALHLYLTQNAFQNGEVTQLRLAFEKVTGKDWNWFFNQWYYKGGHPNLDVNYVYDDARQQLKVIMTQVQPDSIGLYELPMKASIISNGHTVEINWTVSDKKDTFTIAYEHEQRPIVVPDAGHWIPGEWKDNKAPWQWYAQYKYSTDHISKRLALNALKALPKNDTCLLVYTMALQDKDPVLRSIAIDLYKYTDRLKLTTEWKNMLEKIAANDADPKTRAKALHALGDMGETDCINTYEAGISDSSYRVAADALYALDKVNHNRAVTFARDLHPENSKGNYLLYQSALVIGTDGEPQDLAFFKDKTQHLFENERKAFLPTLKHYLTQAKDQSSYEAGIDFLKDYALKYTESFDGVAFATLIRNLKEYTQSQSKIATDPEQIAKWKSRAAYAQNAFTVYKNAVKDEDIKLALTALEKAD
jgi:aminopeptidase N